MINKNLSDCFDIFYQHYSILVSYKDHRVLNCVFGKA